MTADQLRAFNETERQRLADSMLRLSRNEDFNRFLGWIKGESHWGQGPLDASGFNPTLAGYIEGRQSIIRLTEIEIEAAEQTRK